MSTNLEYRERERQGKRESRRLSSEAQREKERQRATARDKKQKRHLQKFGGGRGGGLSKTFSESFLRAGYPSRVQVKFKRKQKPPVFITFLGLKDCNDERCHDIRWYRLRFLQTLVVIFPQKSTQVKIHTKMAIFRLVFSAKNPSEIR